jgi:hypothetical protein
MHETFPHCQLRKSIADAVMDIVQRLAISVPVAKLKLIGACAAGLTRFRRQ